jgi:hypothetical protein
MSDPEETFVARWSRLKREPQNAREADTAPAQAEPEHKVDPGRETAPTAPPRGEPGAGKRPEPGFDVASLPPIESITSASDIRAFLQSGVPAELTRAALRRAWASDPAIRDFIGLAENQWDFTDPTAMPGFGPLEAGDNVSELLAQALGKLPEPPLPGATPSPGARDIAAATSTASAPGDLRPPSQVLGMPAGNEASAEPVAAVELQERTASAALQHENEPEEGHRAPNRRRHGGALPR